MSWMGDESFVAHQRYIQKLSEEEWKPKMFHKPGHKQTLGDYIKQVQREEAATYVQPKAFTQWLSDNLETLEQLDRMELAKAAYEAGRLTGMAQEHALQQMANTGGDYL